MEKSLPDWDVLMLQEQDTIRKFWGTDASPQSYQEVIRTYQEVLRHNITQSLVFREYIFPENAKTFIFLVAPESNYICYVRPVWDFASL